MCTVSGLLSVLAYQLPTEGCSNAAPEGWAEGAEAIVAGSPDVGGCHDVSPWKLLCEKGDTQSFFPSFLTGTTSSSVTRAFFFSSGPTASARPVPVVGASSVPCANVTAGLCAALGSSPEGARLLCREGAPGSAPESWGSSAVLPSLLSALAHFSGEVLCMPVQMNVHEFLMSQR